MSLINHSHSDILQFFSQNVMVKSRRSKIFLEPSGSNFDELAVNNTPSPADPPTWENIGASSCIKLH